MTQELTVIEHAITLEEHAEDMPAWKITLERARIALAKGVEVRIPTGQIQPMASQQPRLYFNKEGIARLALSMSEIGQIVPGIIREIEVKVPEQIQYELIDGERRWRATKLAKIEYRAILVEVDDAAAAFIVAAVANFNRENHTPTEISDSIDRMLKIGIPMEEIANILGISQDWASKMHSLQRLVPEVRDMLDPELPKAQILPTTAAIQVAKAEGTLQLELARVFMERRMSLRELRKKVVDLSKATGAPLRTHTPTPRRLWRGIENQTAQAFRSVNDAKAILTGPKVREVIANRQTGKAGDVIRRLRQLRSLAQDCINIIEEEMKDH